MMVVILLGHIDLSVPWTLAAGAMMATAVGGPWAIPVGIGVGLLVGLVNGLGVAYLRVPSMIFTLGVNAVMRGLMVAHTGGFAPQTAATPVMQYLAVGRIASIPVALLVWLAVSGRRRDPPHAHDLRPRRLRHRQPRARGVPVGHRHATARSWRAFILCGMASGLAGVLLAGYSTKAYQGMGDAYLLPAIAAVVIGGTNILGGRGRYLGTFIGVILIVLLNSVLSIMQMPEAGRQIIYGVRHHRHAARLRPRGEGIGLAEGTLAAGWALSYPHTEEPTMPERPERKASSRKPCAPSRRPPSTAAASRPPRGSRRRATRRPNRPPSTRRRRRRRRF